MRTSCREARTGRTAVLGLTVEQALDLVISWSDNASGAALGRWLGWAEVEAYVREDTSAARPAAAP